MKRVFIAGIVAAAAAWAGANDTFLLKNVTVHPVSSGKVENASVLVVDGRIEEFGPKVAPKGKVKVVEGKGLHVYPGLIDAGSVVGIAEIGSVRETNDTGEIGEFNPQLRAAIAVNPESEHIPVTRANGITTTLVLPAPLSSGRRGGGAVSYITGQAGLMHLAGWTWEEMEIARGAVVMLNWPAISAGGGRGMDPEMAAMFGIRRTTFAEAKRTQEEQVKKIREFFETARAYQKAKAAGQAGLKPDLKLDAMLPVLEGKRPLMVGAVREREIREAVEWAEKEQVKIILAGVRRPGAMTETLAKKQIPVILGSTLVVPMEDDDGYDEPFALPGLLQKAGVKFAFASFDAQFARNLPYEAGQAVPFGLGYEEALKSVTLNAAEILGVGKDYGSIEKGKYADLIVTDGDPLEPKTQTKMMFIKGVAVDLESKHTKLYQKYLARP